jgi:hypothetical protein
MYIRIDRKCSHAFNIMIKLETVAEKSGGKVTVPGQDYAVIVLRYLLLFISAVP